MSCKPQPSELRSKCALVVMSADTALGVRAMWNSMPLRGILCLCALILPSSAYADEPSDSVEKLLRVSGVTAQLDDLPAAILSATPGDALPSSKLKVEALNAMKKAGVGEGRKVLASAVRDALTAAELQQALTFYTSRLGRKVAKAQENALDGSTLRNIRESRKMAATVGKSRSTILQRLAENDGTRDTYTRMLAAVVRGILVGSFGSDEDGAAQAAPHLSDSLRMVDKFMGKDSTRLDDTRLTAYAYTYRSLDDKELQEFLDFTVTETGRKLSLAVQRGMDEAVFVVARGLGEAAGKWKSAGN